MFDDDDQHWFRVASTNLKVILQETNSDSKHNNDWREKNAACLIKYIEGDEKISSYIKPGKHCEILKKQGKGQSLRKRRQSRTAAMRSLVDSFEVSNRLSMWKMQKSFEEKVLTKQSTFEERVDDNLAAINVDVEVIEEKYSDVVEKVVKNDERIDENEKTVNDALHIVENVEEKIVDMDEKIVEVENIALDVQETVDSLEIEHCELEKDVHENQNQISDLRDDFQVIESRVTELEVQFEEVKMSLQERFRCCESSIELLENRVTDTCKALASLSSNNDDILEMIENMNKVISKLESKRLNIEVSKNVCQLLSLITN